LKRALVCGAGGFIGGHLVKRLKIGCPQYVSVDELVATVAEVAGQGSPQSTS